MSPVFAGTVSYTSATDRIYSTLRNDSSLGLTRRREEAQQNPVRWPAVQLSLGLLNIV